MTLSKGHFEQNCWLPLSCLYWLCPSWTNLWKAVDWRINKRNKRTNPHRSSNKRKWHSEIRFWIMLCKSLIMMYFSGEQERFWKVHTGCIHELRTSFEKRFAYQLVSPSMSWEEIGSPLQSTFYVFLKAISQRNSLWKNQQKTQSLSSFRFNLVLCWIQSSLFIWNAVSSDHLFTSTTFWDNFSISKYFLEDTAHGKYCHGIFFFLAMK